MQNAVGNRKEVGLLYFYEVLDSCDTDKAVSIFLNLCKDSPDISKTEAAIRSAVYDMKKIKATISDNEVIGIKRVSTETDGFDAVHMIDKSTGIRHGIEMNPWGNTLGYTVDEKSLDEYGLERFVSLVLWEMTWFGYSEEAIRAHIEGLQER